MSDIFSDSDINENQNIEDLDSCLSYLKKREVFLYKMMNDPNHKAMLYFLEVLLNSDKSLVIEDLVGKFFCKNFTQDMRDACGNNSQGLKKFLEKYPSLFSVNGDYVSAVTIEMPSLSNCSSPNISASKKLHNNNNTNSNNTNTNNSETNTDTDSTSGSNNNNNNQPPKVVKGPVKFDINKETEAVRFFQNKLLKRDEKWVQIKSLAGHLSQANNDIREVVGPQLDFRKFLIRNPHVFEIQGELVSLKDFNQQIQNQRRLKSFMNSHENMPTNTKAYTVSSTSGVKPLQDMTAFNMSGRPKSLNFGSNGFINFHRDAMGALSAPTTPQSHINHGLHLFSRSMPLSMTSNEYRSIIFLRKVIEKKNNSMSLAHLFLYLARSSETIRNVIGWTKFELQEFIRKNSVFFDLTPNEMVVNRRADKVNVIITGASNTTDCGTRTLTNRSGNVFHVAKLWGIIDLGKHEHVFFDKSIFKHLDDLQRHFKIGETLYFNAILAPKESRAKWRATQVWKECDREMVEKFYNSMLLTSSKSTGLATLSDGLSDVASVITEDSLLDENRFNLLSDCFYSNGVSSDEDNNNINGHTTCNIKFAKHDVARVLPDDVEAELTRLLQLTKSSSSSSSNTDDEDEDTSVLLLKESVENKNNNSTSIPPSPDLSSQRSIRSEPSITTTFSSHPLSAPAASAHHYNQHQFYNATNNTINTNDIIVNGHAESCNNPMSNDDKCGHNILVSTPTELMVNNSKKMVTSIGTQTLSTGDIMATNLFHE